MGKIKTKKALKSRFKVTKTGKLKRTKPGKRHILTKKSRKRKRHLKNKALVAKTQAKTYSKLMGLS